MDDAPAWVGGARQETRRAWILILVCSLILTSPLWWREVRGHSYPLNLSWHEGFVSELRAGVFYPRWLNTTNQGLGAPSFYFYAPLPFFVSGICELLSPFRFSTSAYVYTSAVVAVACSGLTLFAFARRVVSAHAAMIASVMYMAMPYHLGIDLWWRAALGELWAFVWAPLILAGIARQRRGERWGLEVVALGWLGLIVSHLPSFVIVLCGATCAAFFWYGTSSDKVAARRVIAASVASFCVAAALSCPYWFPALTTLGYTDVTRFMTSGWFLYSNNFVLPYKLGSWNGTIETLVLTELLGASILLWSAIRIRRTDTLAFRICLVCIVAAIGMMTPVSEIVWKIFPPLQRVQFPWRFHILVDLALVVMFAIVIDSALAVRARRIVSAVVPGLCLAAGVAWSMVFSPHYEASVARDLQATRAARADANEYRTRWTPAPFFYGVRNGDTVISRRVATGVVSTDANGTVRLSRAQMHSVDIVLPRFWYPSLHVSAAIDGRSLTSAPQISTGLAIVNLPAGVSEIRVETVMLAEEKRAWWLSAGTAILVLLWLPRARKPLSA